MTKPFCEKALKEKQEMQKKLAYFFDTDEHEEISPKDIEPFMDKAYDRALQDMRELLENKAKEIESELIVSFDEHQTQSGKLWILAGLLAELEVKP